MDKMESMDDESDGSYEPTYALHSPIPEPPKTIRNHLKEVILDNASIYQRKVLRTKLINISEEQHRSIVNLLREKLRCALEYREIQKDSPKVAKNGWKGWKTQSPLPELNGDSVAKVELEPVFRTEGVKLPKIEISPNSTNAAALQDPDNPVAQQRLAADSAKPESGVKLPDIDLTMRYRKKKVIGLSPSGKQRRLNRYRNNVENFPRSVFDERFVQLEKQLVKYEDNPFATLF